MDVLVLRSFHIGHPAQIFTKSFIKCGFVTFFFMKKKKVTPHEKLGQAMKIQERNDYIPFLSLFPDSALVLL
jgi:hypothetical protein